MTGQDGVARATAVIVDYLTDTGLDWDTGSREGEIVLSLPGEHKQKIVVSLLVRADHISITSFLIRNPDENHEAVYRSLLRRNLRLPGLAYAIDDAGDIFLRGQIPTDALDAARLDEVLGVVHQASDPVFDELLVMGFLTSMQREWDWRISRGESTRNLEAFHHLLARDGESSSQ
jgi:hypothetical protein